MQIDYHNIAQYFYQISDQLHKASFVSLDCQFTGLVTNLEKIQGLFPDHRQFYQRIKQTALNFKIIQFGLTAFVYNQKQKCYQPNTYNFYTLPFVNVQGFNNIMISQVQSLQFLSKHGMNWNRVLQNGIIPKRLIKSFEYKRHNYDDSSYKFDKQYFFCQQDKIIINQIQAKLQIITEKNITQKINFLKGSVFSYFTQKYNNQLSLTKDKKTIDKFQYQVQFFFNFSEKNQIAFSKNFQNQFQQKNNNKYGIQQLLQIIVKRKLPVIGYFPSLDLGLIYHTYFAGLPQTFEYFCLSLNKIFPKIYDVKVISKHVQAKFKGMKASIKNLYEACFNVKTLGPYTNIQIKKSQKFIQNSQDHEAGYDAYITGCAFIGILNCINDNKQGKQLDFDKFQNLTQMTNVIYSKHTGQILLYEPYCKKSIFNYKSIIIWKDSKKNEKYKQIAQQLSKYGSLSVSQDHNETYFVFQEQKQNIEEIINEFKQKYNIVNYNYRKIPKARNMYKISQKQLYFNG